MTRSTGSACVRILGALAALVVVPPAAGQAPTVIYPGPVMGGEFGTGVAALGDVDGDGVPDFVVGSPREDTALGIDVGRARVISGLSGAVLHLFEGDGPDDTFGISVGNAGDVDGDGISDVVVGATEVFPVSSPGTGYAKVFSGATGTLVWQVFGATAGSVFGGSVGSVGDCNGDGRSDFFVSANSITRIYSGLTGTLLLSLSGSRADGGRDVTGDGLPDIVTASGSTGTTSTVRVFSCPTGTLVRTQTVPAKFTPRVTLIDDLDFDGRADIIISDTKSTLGGVNTGVVRVFSGVDGVALFVIAGNSNEFLGWATAALGDMDGDGVEDFGTATAWSLLLVGPMTVKVFSGATGTLLQSLVEPAPFTSFGWSMSAADLTGDGTSDLLVGVVGDTPNGYASGSVFRYDSPTPPYDIVYHDDGCGAALPDPPAMRLVTQAATASATLSFFAGPPSGTALIVLGSPLSPSVQVFTGCKLSIDPAQPYVVLATIPLDSVGAGSLNSGLPTNFSGLTLHTQGAVIDSGGALTLTHGMSVKFN